MLTSKRTTTTVKAQPIVAASALSECATVQDAARALHTTAADVLDRDLAWPACKRRRCPIHGRY